VSTFRRIRSFLAPGAALALSAVAALPAQALQLVHSERSLYRQVLVYEESGQRYLCFTRQCAIGRQSVIDLSQPDRLVFDYAHMMLGSLYAMPAPQNVLIIGLGGGSLPRALAAILPAARIDVVEIDPAVTRVARSYFRFVPGANTSVIEEDGRAYVKRAVRARKSYDLVMLDAYDHEYIPEHLLTREFLQEVKSLLKPGGIVAANTFSSSRLYDSESVTYRAVFGEFYNLKMANRIIIASNGTLPSPATLQQNSSAFTSAFAQMGFDAEEVRARFSLQSDWNPSARVLTDQYSPANLLNSTR
jgi:spermidine synthase